MDESHVNDIPGWLHSTTEKSMNDPILGNIKVQGLEIDFCASEPSLYQWLLEYLNPLPLDSGIDTTLKFRVCTHVDNTLVQQIIHHLDLKNTLSSRVQSGNGTVERIQFSSQIIVDCHRHEGVVWITDLENNCLTLITSNRTRWAALEISRSVRELITGYLEDRGWQAFHSGAVRTDNGTFLIIGNAGAGKTSLILALLSTGATFISNERAYINVIDGEPRVLSFPQPISIGLGTALQYPETHRLVKHPEYCLYPSRRMNIRRIKKTPEKSGLNYLINCNCFRMN